MRTPQPGERRRWLVGGLAVVVFVAVAAWFVRSVVIQDRARPVDTAEALDEFRATQTTTPPTAVVADTEPVAPATTGPGVTPSSSPSTPAPPTTVTPVLPLVEPGIYRYRTTGSERIDALGGTSHDYPPETTITVTTEGCGVRLTWDALRERREEWRLCATPKGIVLQADGVQYHEFYGRGEQEQLRCDLTVLLVPAGTPPAGPVEQSCLLADDPWLPVWEVLGPETRTVDGADVEVRHVRTTIIDEDEYWEDLLTDWYLAPNGLPVEVVSVKSSRSPSIVGPVVYDEEFRLELVSLEPLR
jgi:hypothetical protein